MEFNLGLSEKDLKEMELDRRRCEEEEKALAEDSLVVCSAGYGRPPMGAVLLELRKRSTTSERWIDITDAITGRRRRPGGGRPPPFMRCMKARELREVVNAGLGGMQLPSRKLSRPKRNILKLGSRAERLPRSVEGSLRYQSTILPGLTRRHPVVIVKDILARGARRAAVGAMSEKRLRRLDKLLEAWEASIARSNTMEVETSGNVGRNS